MKNINPGVDCSLYLDDFLICYCSKNIHTTERKLQHNLNNIQDWPTKNDFKFSMSKTMCMHFCQLRKAHRLLKETYVYTVYYSKYHKGLNLLCCIHRLGFRTCPADSLLVEANEPSLNDRREKVSLFALKLQCNRSNPTYNTVLDQTILLFFKTNPI